MTHKTKGIVLKTVKYGETSLIVHVYTELFGIQQYIMNGVRTVPKKGHARANLFQPAAILDLVVYHNELKNLQRIREFKWAFVYQHLFFDIFKNSVALFMIELLHKSLKQPEANEHLFNFVEDALLHLDTADAAVVANFPLYFALQLSAFYGFKFSDRYSEDLHILDLKEGEFVMERPAHDFVLEGDYSVLTSQLLKVMHPDDLRLIKLNRESRRVLLHAYETFYRLHVQEFGSLRTLPVLEEVL